MTEQEWLLCQDPAKMLKWANSYQSGGQRVSTNYRNIEITRRQCILFCCACCRANGSMREDIDEYERTNKTPKLEGETVPRLPQEWANNWVDVITGKITQKWKASILRDILGNPHLPHLNYYCTGCALKVNTGIGVCIRCKAKDVWRLPIPRTEEIVFLAQTAYEELLPNGELDLLRLNILADLLEEAGLSDSSKEVKSVYALCTTCESELDLKDSYCQGNLEKHYTCPQHGWRSHQGVKHTKTIITKDPITSHLRSKEPHVRGCWVLDIILGKEQ